MDSDGDFPSEELVRKARLAEICKRLKEYKKHEEYDAVRILRAHAADDITFLLKERERLLSLLKGADTTVDNLREDSVQNAIET